MENLKGKNILITGGAKGIGRAMALAMAREEANVIIGDNDSKSANQIVEEIRTIGQKSFSIQVDVTNKEAVKEMVETASQKFGQIHVFCNNAGVSSMNWVVDITEEEWDFNMNVNAKGVFFCCQEEAKFLIRQGFGKIINTASMAAKRGALLLSHYCASKYAVVGFSKSLALELAPHGITVNCLCPGFVRTAMQEREIQWEAKLRGLSAEKIREEYIRTTPLGRLEEPEDVAKVAIFLASDYSDFMTGQAINVTGGIETN